MSSEVVTLNDELVTLQNIADEEDEAESVAESDCTEICREMLKEVSPEVQRCGTWSVLDENCNSCVKTRAKAYKKAKKEIAKEQAAQQKKIKEAQKKLLKQEQKMLAQRLKNLKKGRDENYGIDYDHQAKMKAELRKIAQNRAGVDDKPFIIQMYT